MKASEAGRILINALLSYYKSTIPDPNLSGSSETLVSYFVGEEASKALGISQKVNLPKELIALVLDLSFVKQNGTGTHYNKVRNIFLKQSRQQFGRQVVLKIPEFKRS